MGSQQLFFSLKASLLLVAIFCLCAHLRLVNVAMASLRIWCIDYPTADDALTPRDWATSYICAPGACTGRRGLRRIHPPYSPCNGRPTKRPLHFDGVIRSHPMGTLALRSGMSSA